MAKPGDLDLHACICPSGGSARDHEASALVGGGRARQAGGDVLNRDGRAGQDRLLRVDDDAFKVEGRFLGERRLRDQ